MNKKSFILLFSLSLAIRLILLLLIYDQPIKYYSGSDAYNYENIAENLIQHGVFSGETQPPLLPNIYRTPVYPYYITGVFLLTGNSVFAVILIQLLVGSFTSALMLVLAENLQLARQIGWTAGLCLALDPLVVFTTYQMIPETIFIGSLALAFVLLTLYFRRRKLSWLLGSAMVFAFTSLTRPINQFLPFALLPLFFIVMEKREWHQASKNALLFLALSVLITYSWAFQNYYETGLFSLSAIGDYNLLYYRAQEVIIEEQELSEDEARAILGKYVQNEVNKNGLTVAEEVGLMREKAFEIFRQYPMTTLKIHFEGLIKVMANPGLRLFCIMTVTDRLQPDEFGDITSCEADDEDGFIAKVMGKFAPMNWLGIVSSLLEIFLLAGVYIGTVFGIWKLVSKKQWYLLGFLLIPILYFSILSAGGESVARFRIPIVPFLALLAGIGFHRVYEMGK